MHVCMLAGLTAYCLSWAACRHVSCPCHVCLIAARIATPPTETMKPCTKQHLVESQPQSKATACVVSATAADVSMKTFILGIVRSDEGF